jgi:hypothetical protein
MTMKSAPLVFFCAASALLCVSLVFAGEMVELRIETVLASNVSQDFDERLTDIRHELGAFRYKSYHLVQEEYRKVGWGDRADFALPGGRILQVMPKQFANERIALQVLIMEGPSPTPLMNTVLSLKNHGTLFFGGRRHQEGTLIIRIGATAEE